MFRNLKANEIEVRVQSCTEKGCILLLYKDARCDMAILDETVTPLGWKREHLRDNKNCIVSIWSEPLKQWVSKEDTGTESNTEQAKGLASDSFKRACFNWGIGRELYSSPFIFISLNNSEKYSKNQGGKTKWFMDRKVKFKISSIEINEEKHITNLTITDGNGSKRYDMNKYIKPPEEKKPQQKQYQKPPNIPVNPQLVVTEITHNIVKSYIKSGIMPEGKSKDLAKELNDKKLLANQQLVDELIKEYGSLNA